MKWILETEYFTEKGVREENEDAIYPNEFESNIIEGLYMVCDGVGGNKYGEIASDLICKQIPVFYRKNKLDFSNSDILLEAIRYVELQFDKYIQSSKNYLGMASTIALVHFHNNGVNILHIGDSRIYLFRNGIQVYVTKDHSLKQKLVDEQRSFDIDDIKINNTIYKAVQGSLMRPVIPEIAHFKKVQVGDIFLLATDGLINTLNENELSKICSTDKTLVTMKYEFINWCNTHSKDNFSGYLIKVVDIKG